MTPIAGESCPGDCNHDGATTIDEIVTLVGICLGDGGVDDCRAGDVDGDGVITVDEVLKAINAALDGC